MTVGFGVGSHSNLHVGPRDRTGLAGHVVGLKAGHGLLAETEDVSDVHHHEPA